MMMNHKLNFNENLTSFNPNSIWMTLTLTRMCKRELMRAVYAQVRVIKNCTFFYFVLNGKKVVVSILIFRFMISNLIILSPFNIVTPFCDTLYIDKDSDLGYTFSYFIGSLREWSRIQWNNFTVLTSLSKSNKVSKWKGAESLAPQQFHIQHDTRKEKDISRFKGHWCTVKTGKAFFFSNLLKNYN